MHYTRLLFIVQCDEPCCYESKTMRVATEAWALARLENEGWSFAGIDSRGIPAARDLCPTHNKAFVTTEDTNG